MKIKLSQIKKIIKEQIKLNESYDIELFWKGLSGNNKKIGRFIVSKKTYNDLVDLFENEIDFDLYDDKKSGKEISFNNVINIIKNTKYGKIALKK